MEIKFREVIFSISIVAVMLVIGISISERLKFWLLEKYEIYDSAIKIDSEEIFRHGMETNIGYAFVYGDLKALDPVTYPEIKGEYSFLEKEKQEYREHTREVTKEDEDGNKYTETVPYHTWDTIKTETKRATRISFLGVEFEYKKIPFPRSKEIATVKTGHNKRNVYYGTEANFRGTIFTILKDNTINETSFYNNQSIEKTVEYLESGYQLVIFWIFWLLCIGCAVTGFYYLENTWLDDISITKSKGA